jgi:hypothetical protein
VKVRVLSRLLLGSIVKPLTGGVALTTALTEFKADVKLDCDIIAGNPVRWINVTWTDAKGVHTAHLGSSHYPLSNFELLEYETPSS